MFPDVVNQPYLLPTYSTTKKNFFSKAELEFDQTFYNVTVKILFLNFKGHYKELR